MPLMKDCIFSSAVGNTNRDTAASTHLEDVAAQESPIAALHRSSVGPFEELNASRTSKCGRELDSSG